MEDEKNFSLLTTDQLLLSHDQIHQVVEEEDEFNCAEIRVEHDAIAAEMVRRGIEHNTPVVCVELDAVTDAPNYGKSFTDSVCSNCVFGPVDQWCTLYKFHYIPDYVCDSWHPFDTLELQPPHGFLVGKGKQTAIASDKELVAEKPLLIVSDGEVFGTATLDKPATMKASEFDRSEWLEKHCIYPRERRQWWPEADKFYVYPISDWQPFKPTKLLVDGKVVNDLMLTSKQQQLAYKAKQLPKQIIVASDVVGVAEDNGFVIDPSVSEKCGLEGTLSAAFETEVKDTEIDEFLPVYSLALVRNPRMSRMSKKSQDGGIVPNNLHVFRLKNGEKILTEKAYPPFSLSRIDNKECIVNDYTDEIIKSFNTLGESSEYHSRICNEWRVLQKQVEMESLDFTVEASEEVFNRFKRFLAMLSRNASIGHSANFGMWLDGDGADNFKVTNIDLSELRDELDDFQAGFNSIEMAGEDGFYSLALKSRSNKQEEETNMPWEVEPRGDEFCVIKVDDREVEGCHPTREEANAQLAALNISEQEGESAYEGSGDPKKRRRRKKDSAWDKVKGAVAVLTDWLKLEEDEKEMEMFNSDSGFAIKTIGGIPWHFTWSANSFMDREKEIFSTKALEQYVSESEQKGDRGFFNLWHIPFTDFAEKKWQAVVGKFLVEAGPYLDNELGRAAAKFFNEFSNGHPDIAPEGWGCSVEYKYLPEERITGVYDWIWITRTSTLPRSAAANIWTETKQEEIIMTPEQKELLTTMSGDDKLAESIEALGIKITKELEEANIASKENENGSQEQPETEVEEKESQPAMEINLDMDELAEAVGKHFEVNFGAIGEAVSIIADGLKQVQADVEQLKTGAKVKEKTETPRYILNVKRASEAEETEVSSDDSLKDEKPKEAETNSGDMSSRFFRSPK